MPASFFHILFYLLSLLFCRLQPLIQPFKECALPQNAVLRFQHPVVLIGINKQFGRNTAHYGSVKGSHCLVGKDAEILFAMNAEDRGVPFVYEEVGGVDSIKDTGIGIAPENQEKIFTPFFCVDKSRSRTMGGAGLGLALVAEIAQLHNGTVYVSESDSEGSTIILKLPL